MKTKLIATTLLLLLVATFSGCTRTVYVPQKCTLEKPIKHEPINCRAIKDDLSFMQCVAENHTTLEGDYEALEKVFEGCR